MKGSFPKSSRLLKRREFEKVSRSGYRRAGKWILLEISPQPSSLSPRLGITVTRKYGKAHERNRFKRVVREAFRFMSDSLTPLEIIVRPRGKCPLEVPKMSDIYNDLKDILHDQIRSLS